MNLPEELPLGLLHGDFATRNILVGHRHRVTVIDTLAKWHTPIFKDIGCFLANLRLSWFQIISQGLAYRSSTLATYEQAFLKGYFGEAPMPTEAIRLYEILAALDIWAAKLSRIRHRGGILYRSFGSPLCGMINRCCKARLRSLLAEITSRRVKFPWTDGRTQQC